VIGRRLPVVDGVPTFPEQAGDYCGPVEWNGKSTVFFLKPNARDADVPPYTFRECADGSLEIRQSLGDYPFLTPPCQHIGEPVGVYGHGGGQSSTRASGNGVHRGYMGTKSEREQAMGVDWMNQMELSEAVPPAYTEWLGNHVLWQRMLAWGNKRGV